MLTYSRDMEAGKKASQEDRIILLIPTGDPEAPISAEIGIWDERLQRFEGEWRYVEVQQDDDPLVDFAKSDPIAWCHVPAIPADIMDQIVKKAA
jgi:hypothetical protein